MSATRMSVGQVMSPDAMYISPGTCLRDAARRMNDLNCGFLPIGDEKQDKLLGVITDRDIALRGVAEGRDPLETTVDEIKSEGVLYCFQDDPVEVAARSMHDQQIYRLVVLDGRDSKRLCGVISLNDIVRHREGKMATSAAEGIAD